MRALGQVIWLLGGLAMGIGFLNVLLLSFTDQKGLSPLDLGWPLALAYVVGGGLLVWGGRRLAPP